VRFRQGTTIVFAAFLPDGKSVIAAGYGGEVCVWEFPSGKEVRRFAALTDSTATSASLSPDGKHLTVFCDDGFMRILDWDKAKELGKVAIRGAVDSGPGMTLRSYPALPDHTGCTSGA
jgi:WD40 repeat protein